MNAHQGQSTHLFLVRCWSEDGGKDKKWHGRIQHVLSGEAHDFHDWSALIDQLLKMAELYRIEAGAPDGDAKEPFS